MPLDSSSAPTAFTPDLVQLTRRVPPPPPVPTAPVRNRVFAREFLPAWFPMCASKDLRRGHKKPRMVDLGAMKVVLWRDDQGVAHAFESHCPHLGADLAQGQVVDGQLRCALHHWKFRGDGACSSSSAKQGPMRCAKSFPVVERYGVIFVYPARTPAIPFPALPDGDDEKDFIVLVLPEEKAACHYHLPTANGLDGEHFEGLHGLDSITPWSHDVDEAAVAIHMHLHHRFRNPILGALIGEVKSRFSTFGPSLAWVTAFSPVGMHALFATRPDGAGGCVSRAIVLVKKEKPIAALRVIAFVAILVWEDRMMLKALHDFKPAYVDTDAPLRAHSAMLDTWPRG